MERSNGSSGYLSSNSRRSAIYILVEKDTTKETWDTLKVLHMDADRVKEAQV